jgi:hypothetical protein
LRVRREVTKAGMYLFYVTTMKSIVLTVTLSFSYNHG